MIQVLVVDDEIHCAEGVKCAIDWHSLGIEYVFTAYSMAQAQQIMAREENHILISDVEMPKGNGFQLLQWIRDEGYTPVTIMLTRFQGAILSHCGIHISVYLGEFREASQVAVQYVRLMELDENNVVERPGIYSLEEQSAQADYERPDIEAWMKEFSAGNYEKTIQKIERCVDLLSHERRLDQGSLTQLLQDFMQSFYIELGKKELQAHQLFADEASQKLYRRAGKSVKDFKVWVNHIVQKSAEYVTTASDAGTVVHSVKKFIREHLDEELSRNQIAGQVCMSPDYVSRVFHQETGILLSEYIVQTRMEEAERLLESTSLPVGEVACRGGYFNLAYFSHVFRIRKGMTPYGMSFVVTGLGTVCSILLTTSLAYAISKRGLPGGKVLTFLVFFTMLFNGGLVPTYLMYADTFHIKNTIWALIIPNLLVRAYYVMLMRSYFLTNLPGEVLEAASIDGATEFQIYRKVAIPMSKPIIATVLMFAMIMYWNDWQNGLYYITTKTNLYTIQNLLNRMIQEIQFLSSNAVVGQSADISTIPSTTVRMAIAVIGILPIAVVYPFVQKNFAKGITLGAVKG